MPTILLVEDNEMNRDMLSQRLKRQGYEILLAVDGQQAIELTQQHLPGIVLMDMSLPVMDGWTATKQLKANPATQHIPIIALTAHAMVGDREKALAAGCDEYETKPIDFKALLEKIRRFLTS